MVVELTKSFAFSASYASGSRSIGRNFTLQITVEATDEDGERALESIVERELISKIHSRDLSQHVDFLKNIEIDDASLLKAFWSGLAKPLEGRGVKRLALQRDSKTITTLHL